MKTRLGISILLAVLGVSVLSGCERVGEPWDNTGYFAKERTRTAAQQRALQLRLNHTQNEYEQGAHTTGEPKTS